MSGQTEKDWASFYEAAYERQKRHNHMLAAKLAEAETKQGELEQKVNRICGSPFWKITAPVRKWNHLTDGIGRRRRQALEEQPSEADLSAYTQELERQQDPYLQWIRQMEGEETIEAAVPVGEKEDGIWILPVPDTDLLLVGYGKGFLATNTDEKVKTYFNNYPGCLLAYPDEDFYWKNVQHRMEPWMKPCYSPDTLLSFNCMGHLVAVRTELAERTGLTRLVEAGKGKDTDAVFYDLCLRLEENSRWDSLHVIPGVFQEPVKIGHIDAVLFHQEYRLPDGEEESFANARRHLQETLEAGEYLTGAGESCLAVRQEALSRRGIRAFLQEGPDPGIYHVVYDTAISGRERCNRAMNSRSTDQTHFLVSVIIPSKDHPDILENCLVSFLTKTAYANVEFVIVDNGSSAENRRKAERELRKKLEKLWTDQEREGKLSFHYIYKEMPFNFSKMCNLGASKAAGDLFLFLNDDIEIIEESWLDRMVGQALQPHTGAVGARLWYAGSERIQHAGITNLPIGPSHKLITFLDDRDYYYGHNRVSYDMAGVTGACLLVAKDRYEQVGGMDETMAVSYNDVDLCFKLLEAGYYNVLRNDAVLYHHESLSRGLDEQDGEKWKRLLAEKDRLYEKHLLFKGKDPFYSKALIGNASDYRCAFQFAHEQQLATVKPERIDPKQLKRRKEEMLRLTVDRAEPQHKIYLDEPDILWIMGWSYLPGADNAAFERKLLLQRADGVLYQADPALWNRKDVEKILPMEKHVGLAGFVLRVLKKDLEPGEYRVGMLAQSGAGKGGFLAWSDKTLRVE